MVNQIVFNNPLDSSHNVHVQRGVSRPGTKPNKERLVLFYVELLYNACFVKESNL